MTTATPPPMSGQPDLRAMVDEYLTAPYLDDSDDNAPYLLALLERGGAK